jgi:CHAT domain-containing protein
VNIEVAHAARALPRDVVRITGLKRKQVSTRLAYEDFQARLYAAHPDLRVRRASVPIVQVAEAQQLLGNRRGAIVEFSVALDRVTAFVITHSELQAFELPVGIAQLTLDVTQFREQLARRDLRAGDSARRLYGMVLGPMRAALHGINELVIVPDGILWDLPFQALQSAPNRYVIEDTAVSYAPSVTVLREAMRRPSTGPAARTLLAFGNPAALPSRSLPSLPDAEHEVETLAQMYGASSRVYVGADATEERWKAEAPNYRVVHLAAHGVLDNSSPMYSHLTLAAPGPGSTQDGLLEAWEIMNVPLGAELVVLSACETARGKIAPGEGVIGVMWALFVGGSPATLVSQWQVESKSSSDLMIAFHRAWNAGRAGTSKARALQLASLQLLRTAETSHPFYWAGFVLVGDAR